MFGLSATRWRIKMPYVTRWPDGRVKNVYESEQFQGQEYVIGEVVVSSFESAVEENVTAIKTKAGELIVARVGDSTKQRNLLARKSELQDKRISGEILTPEEQAEWDWIKAVRATSNAAEVAGTPVDQVVWPL